MKMLCLIKQLTKYIVFVTCSSKMSVFSMPFSILTRWFDSSGINNSIHMTTPCHSGCLQPARVLDLAVHASVVHGVQAQVLVCSSVALISSLMYLFREAVVTLRLVFMTQWS